MASLPRQPGPSTELGRALRGVTGGLAAHRSAQSSVAKIFGDRQIKASRMWSKAAMQAPAIRSQLQLNATLAAAVQRAAVPHQRLMQTKLAGLDLGQRVSIVAPPPSAVSTFRLASARIGLPELPTAGVLSGLRQVVSSGDADNLIDAGELHSDLMSAIEEYAQALAEANPVLNITTARAMMILFVHLLCLAALLGLAVWAPVVSAGAGYLVSRENVGDRTSALFDRLVFGDHLEPEVGAEE